MVTPAAARPREVVPDSVKASLLIVDDEQTGLRALCEMLSLQGYSTRGCASSEKALAEVRAGQCDLLISNLTMPDMDGLTLSAEARRIDPELGAIVMSGEDTLDRAARAMQAGTADYIRKPFELNALLAAVSRALETRRLRRECARARALEERRVDELELADRDLAFLSHSVWHDLRAPLRAISSFGQILDEDHGEALGPEGRRILGVIRNGSRTMDQLVTGLQEFSRAANDTRRLSIGVIDMTSLAEAASREALVLHQGPTPRIEIAELPEAMGDATVLRQVWSNLIGNALKYSAKRPEPHIEITGRLEGAEALYQVQDNGVGYDVRYAEKLFGIFQRLHKPEEFPGAGVGLAIALRIITRHGGRIWAEAVPNQGACFGFALPIEHTAGRAARGGP
jgi:signal transduction histidine kinase